MKEERAKPGCFYGNKRALVCFVRLFFPLVLSLLSSFFSVLPLFLLLYLLCHLVLLKSFFFKICANKLPFCIMSLFLLGSIVCPMPAPSGYQTVPYDCSFGVLYCAVYLFLLGPILCCMACSFLVLYCTLCLLLPNGCPPSQFRFFCILLSGHQREDLSRKNMHSKN